MPLVVSGETKSPRVPPLAMMTIRVGSPTGLLGSRRTTVPLLLLTTTLPFNTPPLMTPVPSAPPPTEKLLRRAPVAML